MKSEMKVKDEMKPENPGPKTKFTVEEKFLAFVKHKPESDSASKEGKPDAEKKPSTKFEVDIKEYGLKVEEDCIPPLAYQPEFGLPGWWFSNLRPRTGEFEFHPD